MVLCMLRWIVQMHLDMTLLLCLLSSTVRNVGVEGVGGLSNPPLPGASTPSLLTHLHALLHAPLLAGHCRADKGRC